MNVYPTPQLRFDPQWLRLTSSYSGLGVFLSCARENQTKFVSSRSHSSHSFSGVNTAEEVLHRAINQVNLCDERESRWMEESLFLPFPGPFLLSHLPNSDFSLHLVGLIFHMVYFYLLRFLVSICFTSVFATLGNWSTLTLNWKGCRTY